MQYSLQTQQYYIGDSKMQIVIKIAEAICDSFQVTAWIVFFGILKCYPQAGPLIITRGMLLYIKRFFYALTILCFIGNSRA
jgi:hypothetical protein